MKTLSVTPPPAPKEEPKVPIEVVNTTTKQEPLEKSDASDRPFSAEYFDVPEWGRLLLEPKLDVHGITTKVLFIENYLKEQLSRNSMKSDRDSFREILSDIEQSLGIDSRHDVKHRISRVYGFLNVIKLTKEKEEIRRKRLLSVLKK